MISDKDDTAIVRMVARGIIELGAVARLASFSMPYPRSAQLALDKLVATLLETPGSAPLSVPGLVDWARYRPLKDWPLSIPDDLLTGDDLLISARTGNPSQLCVEWAADRGELERNALESLRRLADDCSTADKYLRHLMFLVERPVVIEQELLKLQDRRLLRVWHRVRDLYEPVPQRYVFRDAAALCSACRFLMVPAEGMGWVCETDDCASYFPDGDVHAADQLFSLPLGLRWFVAHPGRTELALRGSLESRGAAIDHRHDHLVVTWQDDESWVLMTRDRLNPALLARSIGERAADLRADRVLVVVPGNRLVAQPDYREIFARNLPTAASTAELVGDDELIDLASARSCRP
ncbi:hypothetical protein [Saccharopolyspora taberi]|uniref:REase associating with pPIWI RE domain-containing protein n=1 Tax=Saccharopolyspora taberi TaxID=60895 RepID=A0ABN3V069_9PSEU